MNRADLKILTNYAKENDLSSIFKPINYDGLEESDCCAVRINEILYINPHQAYFLLKRLAELDKAKK